MNLQPYRSSFRVIVADSDALRGNEILRGLKETGYSCELCGQLSVVLKAAIENPPHVLLFNYGDPAFFPSEEKYQEIIDKFHSGLPEVHIFFLARQKDFVKACELYKFGVYDCLIWPLPAPQVLLRAVDRAAEADYYMYLNERLKEERKEVVSPHLSFALFHLWQKSVEKGDLSHEELLRSWMREAARVFQTDRVLFMRYLESKKTLMVADTFGFAVDELEHVGLDLEEEEPGFEPKMLRTPERIGVLRQFVTDGLRREQACFFSLIHKNRPLGIFVVAARKGERFTNVDEEREYLKTCLQALNRQMDVSDLQSRLAKFSVYDDESEALHSNHIRQRVTEEVSRARRLQKPVSVLSLEIDAFDDMTLAYSQESLQKLLKSFTDILVKNSRINDLVGRMERGQYTLCLPHTDARGGAVKAERLRRLIETADFSPVLGTPSRLTVSAGVSEYPSVCHDADELMRSSEVALCEVKKAGRNKICLAAAPPRFVPDFVVTDGKNN